VKETFNEVIFSVYYDKEKERYNIQKLLRVWDITDFISKTSGCNTSCNTSLEVLQARNNGTSEGYTCNTSFRSVTKAINDADEKVNIEEDYEPSVSFDDEDELL
jgi:hypothetical protein